MKTYSVKAGEIKRETHVIDAAGVVLGKLAAEAAQHLMGKYKPMYSRHLDTGDRVVVINAAQIMVTGNKMTQKQYARHSGYAGGFKTVSLEQMMKTKPEMVIQHAVRGMLPRNTLGDAMIKKLRVYAGAANANKTKQQPTEA
jgi:large subunit ribosomal protein L13